MILVDTQMGLQFYRYVAKRYKITFAKAVQKCDKDPNFLQTVWTEFIRDKLELGEGITKIE